MGLIPAYDEHGHELNAWSKWMGPVALVALVGAVIVLQQVARSFREERLSAVPAARAASEVVSEPGIAPLTVESKAAVRMSRLGTEDNEKADKEEAAEAMHDLDELAETRVDKLRVALVAGELVGKKEALTRLRALAEETGRDSELASDVAWFTRLYTRPDEVTQDSRETLIARHGWFARLALSFGLPDRDGFRSDVVGHGGRIAMLGLVYTLASLVMGGLAVILMVGTIVAIRRREWESELETTNLPGSVYLEMFLIFLGLFVLILGLQIVTLWMTGPASVAGMAVGEMLIWLLPLALVWPRLRGMDWSELATDLGLSVGAGVRTEVKAGVVGYLASMPLVVLIGWAAHAVEKAMGGEEGAGRYSPFESTLGNSWIPVLLGTLGAVVWAPITEEIMFRGAFYRALRGRLGVILAVVISAAVFGAIHPYSTTGLLTVGASGLVFALLREWRGSLVAPMTAHFLNNATISGMQVMYLLAVD